MSLDWMPQPIAAQAGRLFTASRFVREHCERASPVLLELAARGALLTRDGPGALAARVAAPGEALDLPAAMLQLRQRRNAEMVRIAIRDIQGLADLDETLGALSDLADASLAAALAYADTRLRERYGVPRDEHGAEVRMLVIGMGKLGGRELNFSSDIDLIFAYTAPGASDGSAALSNEEYFAKLVQDCTRLLATPTEDGFVFRIDTLLRPFGSAGAVAVSVDAMERYYEQHGREWERYALIKARPVAGDLAAGRRLLQRLRPFVYRRYLDFSALGALRELKRLIDQDAQRRGADQNLKLGHGGIRELEFIVQLFQLTRGGHDVRLRDTRLRPVLRQLGAQGLLPADTVDALDRAYVWLRRCENAIQLYGDEQTHLLPTETQRQTALCAALGYERWAALMLDLDATRARVREEYERLFVPADGAAPAGSAGFAEQLWDEEPAQCVECLRERGFAAAPERVARAVAALRDARLVRTLGDAALQRLQGVVARLLDVCVGLPDPETAAERTLNLIHAIAGRGTYLALLRESPRARGQLVRLCAASPWIAAQLAQTPALLDTLLDPRLAEEAPDRAAIAAELADRAAGTPPEDIEAVMDLMRRFRQETMLRIAAADLSGSLPLVRVSDRLTWLAEAILAYALDCARLQLSAQYGQVQRSDGGRGEFAVIAYGKFGSIELGYGSDLDLVFVYDTDDADAPTVGGQRSLAAADWFVRLAQRVVQLLSAQTGAGRAYEIDLQLRPSGNSGLAVTRLAGFERYQREHAWIWEHQALLRARVVAGDDRLAAAIARVRREVLCAPRDLMRLRDEVIAMRAKMRAALEKREHGRWDVKQGSGGLIDAEFLTQYLCLAHAAAHPPLVEWSDNWRQLEALAAASVIDAAQRDRLLAAERAFRGYLHRQALQQQDGLADDVQFVMERTDVCALWQGLIGGKS